MIATIDDAWSWALCIGEADLVLFDATGAEVKRLPLFSTSDMTNDEARDCPFKRAAKPKLAARVAAAQRVLTDLGFSVVAGGDAGVISTTEKGLPKASFPRAKLGLVMGTDRVRILRGDEERGSAPSAGGQLIVRVDHLPELDVVVLRWGRGAREGLREPRPQRDSGHPGEALTPSDGQRAIAIVTPPTSRVVCSIRPYRSIPCPRSSSHARRSSFQSKCQARSRNATQSCRGEGCGVSISRCFSKNVIVKVPWEIATSATSGSTASKARSTVA